MKSLCVSYRRVSYRRVSSAALSVMPAPPVMPAHAGIHAFVRRRHDGGGRGGAAC
jgi:hypothetical protein